MLYLKKILKNFKYLIYFFASINYDTGLKSSSGDKKTIIEALKERDINNINNNNLISISGNDNLIKV